MLKELEDTTLCRRLPAITAAFFLFALASGCASAVQADGPVGASAQSIDGIQLFEALQASEVPEDTLPKALATSLIGEGVTESRKLGTAAGVEFYVTAFSDSVCLQYGRSIEGNQFEGGTVCGRVNEIEIHPVSVFDLNLKLAAVLLPDKCSFTSSKDDLSISKNVAVEAGDHLSGAYSCDGQRESVNLDLSEPAVPPPFSTVQPTR